MIQFYFHVLFLALPDLEGEEVEEGGEEEDACLAKLEEENEWDSILSPFMSNVSGVDCRPPPPPRLLL